MNTLHVDKSQSPRFLPVLPKPVGRMTVPVARFAVFVTVLAWIGYVFEQGVRLDSIVLTPRVLMETAVYFVTVTMLTISCLAYLLSRLGHFERVQSHRRVPRSTIDTALESAQPSMSVLVPSYREEERIIRYTLLSAALQEYPRLKVVLLIDDPPTATDAEHRLLLEQSRRLPQELASLLGSPHQKFKRALEDFEQRTSQDIDTSPEEMMRLAMHYYEACEWFKQEQADLELSLIHI